MLSLPEADSESDDEYEADFLEELEDDSEDEGL